MNRITSRRVSRANLLKNLLESHNHNGYLPEPSQNRLKTILFPFLFGFLAFKHTLRIAPLMDERFGRRESTAANLAIFSTELPKNNPAQPTTTAARPATTCFAEKRRNAQINGECFLSQQRITWPSTLPRSKRVISSVRIYLVRKTVQEPEQPCEEEEHCCDGPFIWLRAKLISHGQPAVTDL